MAGVQQGETSATVYRMRRDGYSQQISELAPYDRGLSIARTVAFVLAVLTVLLALADAENRLLWWLCAGGAACGFVALAFWHDQILQRIADAKLRQQLNTEQLARCARSWSEVPWRQVELPADAVSLARDLDLFGPASLFHYVNLTSTPLGTQRLRDWLLVPASPHEILDRQSAVRELAPQIDLREHLQARGRQLADSFAHPERFLNWAEDTPWLATRPWLTWLARLLPAGLVATFGLACAGTLAPTPAASIMVALVGLNIVLSVLFTGQAHDIFDRVSTRAGEMLIYSDLFKLVGDLPGESPVLVGLAREVSQTGRGARPQLRRLGRIMFFANLKHYSLLSIVYLVLQILFLWDFHVLTWLERWQRRAGCYARRWFQALGEVESLASLAALAFDNPHWTFPQVDATAALVSAQRLGHPLLRDDVRVGNDVQVGPPGTVLLVTGSNMSGKSTLLRSLGVNITLAQAGGPVCAANMTMPIVRLATSMRISDSLSDGVSFYMAELRRLKEIVDLARERQSCPQERLLYLLDEILQGTNSVERHIAVSRVLAHLVEYGAIGAVSTHDLELARAPELARACQPVHFRETLHDGAAGQRMTFDYQMRPGVATTTNALKLLEMMGLGEGKGRR